MTCDAPVTDAVLTMQMERRVANSWKVVASNVGYSGKKNPRLGDLKAGSGKVRQVEAPCVNGTYRASAKGSAVLNGVASGMRSWKYGNTSDVTCG